MLHKCANPPARVSSAALVAGNSFFWKPIDATE